MSNKYALVIGNTEYADPGLAQLTAPGKDAEDFARVLKDTEIGAFDDVVVLLNQAEYVVREAIDDFFNTKMPDDLLVLYFSGHGVRDELGALYLAVKNTVRSKLRATGIKSDYIREAMDQSRSRRQVLVLDCCNSGAFSQGTKAATGVSIGTATAFESGYGRVILTASDSTQFAWEGDKVIGKTDNSLFTHYLVEGLEGEADLDGDGRITVDELYDYTYAKVKFATPKQTPSKFSTRQQGEIVLRQKMRVENIKPIALSNELVDEIEDPRPYVREEAVRKLEKIIKGRNIGLARSAREALGKIASDDDSRRVSQAALQILESYRLVEEKAEAERRAREEADRLATLKAEEERLMREKAEAERKAKEETEKLARAKAEREAAEREAARLKAERKAAEVAAREASEKASKEKIKKEAVEFDAVQKAEHEVVKLASRKDAGREATKLDIVIRSPKWISVLWITLGWVIGLAFGGAIGSDVSYAIVGGLATAITLYMDHVLSHWKSVVLITLGWMIGLGIDWAIGSAMARAIGYAIAGAIGLDINSQSGWPFFVVITVIEFAIMGIIGGLITAIVLHMEHALSDWKGMLWTTLGWGIFGAIGVAIVESISGGTSGVEISWVIVWATGVAIGAFVMIWQIRKSRT